MSNLVFTVQKEYESCALHSDDNNGFVFPLRSQIESVIGVFKLEKGFAITVSEEKYKVDIKGFTVTFSKVETGKK
jgi:hypothetical protein